MGLIKLKPEVLIQSGNAIYNDDIRIHLGEIISSWFSDSELFSSMVNIDLYKSTFKNWIASSQLNEIKGLESFPLQSVSLGVTQAIDQFHFQAMSSGRKIRAFRGEYPYSWQTCQFKYSEDFIDDRPLEENDAVILSYPFSGNGGKHPKMDWLLSECARLNIPVFLDMAWFGTCEGINIDLSHPAITTVAFSLTKGLTCGNYRSGMRFQRDHFSDLPTDKLVLQDEWNHSIHLNLMIGIDLMKNFSADTQVEKYRIDQKEVCTHFGITPSQCVHIATSDDSKWNDFSRDGAFNRINIREAIKKLRNGKKSDN